MGLLHEYREKQITKNIDRWLEHNNPEGLEVVIAEIKEIPCRKVMSALFIAQAEIKTDMNWLKKGWWIAIPALLGILLRVMTI